MSKPTIFSCSNEQEAVMLRAYLENLGETVGMATGETQDGLDTIPNTSIIVTTDSVIDDSTLTDYDNVYREVVRASYGFVGTATRVDGEGTCVRGIITDTGVKKIIESRDVALAMAPAFVDLGVDEDDFDIMTDIVERIYDGLASENPYDVAYAFKSVARGWCDFAPNVRVSVNRYTMSTFNEMIETLTNQVEVEAEKMLNESFSAVIQGMTGLYLSGEVQFGLDEFLKTYVIVGSEV